MRPCARARPARCALEPARCALEPARCALKHYRRAVRLRIERATGQSAAPRPAGRNASATRCVRLVVNGEPRELQLDPRQSLLDVLRETLDLTGTKKGCNQGACGACTILVNGQRIVSCLTLAAMHDGARVETIEAVRCAMGAC